MWLGKSMCYRTRADAQREKDRIRKEENLNKESPVVILKIKDDMYCLKYTIWIEED